jgi:hypothetical protein
MIRKSVSQGEMIDLHSVVTFLDKAKGIELGITSEINWALWENTISDLAVRKYIWMFVSAERKNHSDLL